jgi:hypothetical protein
MKMGADSKLLGRKRGTAPFPGAPSPKTKPGRLHKSLDTPATGQLRQAHCTSVEDPQHVRYEENQ